VTVERSDVALEGSSMHVRRSTVSMLLECHGCFFGRQWTKWWTLPPESTLPWHLHGCHAEAEMIRAHQGVFKHEVKTSVEFF
jgi:hypothetical protein